ncbi:MAG: MOSC domain-containing protein [Chthoniobacterales bacterium]
MQISHLYISPGHNFFGRHGQPAGDHPIVEVDCIECVAGHGIRGDRFFDFRDDYKGQVTFFAGEVYDALCARLDLRAVPPSAARRNVITRGTDLNALIGKDFDLQGVRLRGIEECRPCAWMDHAFASGAEEFLKGNGGLRARILSDGAIRVTTAAEVST